MAWDVDVAVRDTKEALIPLIGKSAVDKMDFSYITKELLDTYETDAKEKDADLGISEEILDEETGDSHMGWVFWGNNLTYRKPPKKWFYRNGNPSTGSDYPSHMCGIRYQWSINYMGHPSILPLSTCKPPRVSPFKSSL